MDTSNTYCDSDSPAFRARLQALPTELFDEIVALVFSVSEGTPVLPCFPYYVNHLPRQIHFPGRLYVSKATRAVLVKSFYGNSKFRFRSLGCIAIWLDIVPAEHRRLLWDFGSTSARSSEDLEY
jgi:hypothetical protein